VAKAAIVTGKSAPAKDGVVRLHKPPPLPRTTESVPVPSPGNGAAAASFKQVAKLLPASPRSVMASGSGGVGGRGAAGGKGRADRVMDRPVQAPQQQQQQRYWQGLSFADKSGEEIDETALQQNIIRQRYVRQREELQKRRTEIVAEMKVIDEGNRQSNDAIVPSTGRGVMISNVEGSVDYTKIPSDLDAALEKLDLEGALRPAIINVGKTWSKQSQKGLLGNATDKSLAVTEQKLEKQACFDLLDGLTKSGSRAFGIEGAALHIVVSTTHWFEKNLMDTLVRENVNPIAKVEHSALIVAGRIFGKSAEELVVESERERIAAQSTTLC
jgi:hypothetical protein